MKYFVIPLFFVSVLFFSACSPLGKNPIIAYNSDYDSSENDTLRPCGYYQCDAKVIDTPYCTEHTCRAEECMGRVLEDGIYCFKHDYLNSNFCADESGCEKPRAQGSFFCEEHKAAHDVRREQLIDLAIKERNEFTKTNYYYPECRPKHVSDNVIFSYIKTEDDYTPQLKLAVHYSGDNWVFFNCVKLNVDGKRYEFKIDRDDIAQNNGNGIVWEHAELTPGPYIEEIMLSIAAASNVNITYQGRDYSSERTLSAEELLGMGQTMQLYKSMLLR